VFALRREAMFFRRMRRRRSFPAAPFPAVFHGEGPRTVLVLETGVGCDGDGKKR